MRVIVVCMSDHEIELLIPSRRRELVPGAFVRRVLPYSKRRSVGPFVFLDHMGPDAFGPGEGADIGPHPHIGLSTLTYLYTGRIRHRDSTGADRIVGPGDVSFMTGGRAVAHSERTPEEDREKPREAHGLQLWVALPREHEEDAPSYQYLRTDQLPAFEDRGAHVKLIAGTWDMHTSPLAVHAPTLCADVQLEEKASLEVPTEYAERAIYVTGGRGRIGDTPLESGMLAVLASGASATFHAESPCRALVLGGAPLDGPRILFWNFVASTEARIERARHEWENDLFPTIPGETGKIPIPEHLRPNTRST